MNVPLDRLYNFLQDVCNRDVIIYRFWPHGAKNWDTDCLPLEYYDWFDLMSKPHAFFHDQEPVDITTLPINQTHIGNIYPANSPYPWVKNKWVPFQFFDRVILVHSEVNSLEVEILRKDGYIPVHWFSHALIARDWFRYAEVDPILECHGKFKHKFLIYNRAWSNTREYRLWFAEQLIHKELLPHCQTTMAYSEDSLSYRDYKFTNPQWQISSIELEKYLPDNQHGSYASADYVNTDYANSAAEVVLETLFDTDKIFITEKTLRPLATGRPFLLMAPAGSLEYLRRYGFETFAPWFNEDYDYIKDPKQRACAVLDEMQRLNNLSFSEFVRVIDGCNEIAKRNRCRFFSQEFFQQVVGEYQNGMNTARLQAFQHLSTTNWDTWAAATSSTVPDVSAIKKQLGLN